jgi:galactokinase
MTDFATQLIAGGVSDGEAIGKAHVLQRAREVTGVAGGERHDEFAAFVPGRVEVLGKHTDYAGGRSLLCAAERGICVVATPRADRLVRVTDVVSGERVETALETGAVHPVDGWGLYVATVARRVARNFADARRGADIAFGSDLPMAAGMSSSSALVTSVLLALSAVNHLDATETYRAPGARIWPSTSGRSRTARISGS